MSHHWNRFAVLSAVLFPIAAFADINGSITMGVNAIVNMDTAATVTSGGDFQWSGSVLTPQGNCKALNATVATGSGPTGFSNLTQALLSEFAGLGSNAPLTGLTVGTVIGYETNGGNFGKFLVTAISGTSITLQYTTYGVTGTGGGPTAPTITGVYNNYNIPTGFPTSPISPSALIAIKGTNLATSTISSSSAGSGLPSTSGGASVSVTVGGTTVNLGLYYVSAGQIDAVLPASTPTGTGTLTVSVGGTPSSAFAITVAASAPAIGTYGSNQVIATTLGYAVFGYTNSASPGETIIIWGSGLGADPGDSDTVYSNNPQKVNQSATQIYFGTVPGTVTYAGSSGFPGLNQINVVIPPNAPTGCNVSVAGTVNGIVSNFGSLAIAANGGLCSDPAFGINGTTIGTLTGDANVRGGSVLVGQLITPNGTGNSAIANFSKTTGANFGSSSSIISLGSCNAIETVTGGAGSSTGLNAGTSIGLTGPAGSYTLNQSPAGVGNYIAQLPAGAIPSTGGSFTFTGTGGSDVGGFTATVTMPNPLLTWTNQSAAATVTRSSGVTVTWSGGTSGSFVIIMGESSGTNGGGSFTCFAPQSAGTFTVPAFVTASLPAGTGSLTIENGTNFIPFSASGLDSGIGFGFSGVQINSTYQ